MEADLAIPMHRLNDQVHAAEAPDRDLDAEISWRLAPEMPEGFRLGGDGSCDLSGPTVFDGLFPDWRTRDDVVPRYTESLDAALRLAGPRGERALRYALQVARPDEAPLSGWLALQVVKFVVNELG